MKKLILSICLSLCFLWGASQPFVTRSGPANTVQDSRWAALYNAFLPRYLDTTAANLALGVDTSGAIIYTYTGKTLWYRQHSPKAWVQAGSGGGGVTQSVITDTLQNYWRLTGNNVTDGKFLGSVNNRSVLFHTNNTFAAVIDSNQRLGLGTRLPTRTFSLEEVLWMYSSGGTQSRIQTASGYNLRLMGGGGEGISLIPNAYGATPRIGVIEDQTDPNRVYFNYISGGATEVARIGISERNLYLKGIADSTSIQLRATDDASVYIDSSRFALSKGTATASANDLSLPFDGNLFSITGNTQINAIETHAWQPGSIIYLTFTGTPTLKNNTAGSAGTAPLLLAGRVDYVAASGDVIAIQYDGTNFKEIARSIAGTAPNAVRYGVIGEDVTYTADRSNNLKGLYTHTWDSVAQAYFNLSSDLAGPGRFLITDATTGNTRFSVTNNISYLFAPDGTTGFSMSNGAVELDGIASSDTTLYVIAINATTGDLYKTLKTSIGSNYTFDRGLINSSNTVSLASFYRSAISYAEASPYIPTQIWTKTTETTQDVWRDGALSFVVNDTLFVAGGYHLFSSGTTTDSIWYSVNNGTTFTLYDARLPYALANTAIIQARFPGDWNYIIGASFPETNTKRRTVFRFKHLHAITTMTTAAEWGVRSGQGAAQDEDGNIFIFGGATSTDTTTALQDVWMSTATSGGAVWTQIQSGLTWMGGELIDNVVYRDGFFYIINANNKYGNGNNAYGWMNYKISSQELISGDETKWVRLDDSPAGVTRQIFISTQLFKGNIFAGLGYNIAASNTDSIAYLDKNDKWRAFHNFMGVAKTPSSPQTLADVHAASMVVHKDGLYVLMGSGSNTTYVLKDSVYMAPFFARNHVAINYRSYFSETLSGQGTIFGNGVVADPDANNQVIRKTSEDAIGFRLQYDLGWQIFVLNSGNSTQNTGVAVGTGYVGGVDASGIWRVANDASYNPGSWGGILRVKGSQYLSGLLRAPGLTTALIDTTTYKPLVYNADGDVIQMTNWPVGGGGSGTVNAGLAGELAWYPSNGTTVDGNPATFYSDDGTLALLAINTGSSKKVQLGSRTTFPGIWFGDVTASFTNYAFLYDVATGTILNTPSGQSFQFRVNNTNYLWLNPTGGLSLGVTNYNTDPGASNMIIEGDLGVGVNGDPTMKLMVTGGRFGQAKGANVAAAGDLTLGADGNLFTITGNTQINAITATNWQSGSKIALIFTGAPLVKNNTTGGAGTAPLLLAGRVDYQAAAGDYIAFQFDGTNWYETNRQLAATATGTNIYNSNGTTTGVRTVTLGNNAITWNGTQASSANYAFNVANSSAGGAIGATNAGLGNAISGASTTGTGIAGSATSGIGISGSVTTGVALTLRTTIAATNTETIISRHTKGTDGTAAAGLGGYFSLQIEDDASNDQEVVRLGWVSTSVADGAETADFKISTTNAGSLTEKLRVTGNGRTIITGRLLLTQGADVASAAGAIALGLDGNVFEITGTAAITLISNLNWQNGSEITLVFTSTATLTDGTANSGTDIGMELAGNANFSASADDVLTLVLSEIGGTQRWREKSRSVN